MHQLMLNEQVYSNEDTHTPPLGETNKIQMINLNGFLWIIWSQGAGTRFVKGQIKLAHWY